MSLPLVPFPVLKEIPVRCLEGTRRVPPSGFENCKFFVYSDAFSQFFSLILVSGPGFGVFFEIPGTCFGACSVGLEGTRS